MFILTTTHLFNSISPQKLRPLGSERPHKNWVQKPIVAMTLPDKFQVGVRLAGLVTAFTLSSFLTLAPFHEEQAIGGGLFLMPPSQLNNSYYLVRAGESEFERRGIINTNPVAKTSIDNGLSKEGAQQSLKGALHLKEMGACAGNCWIWASITQRAYQTGELISYINNVSRSRLVPEYSFLDARGYGSYEGRELQAVNEIYKTDLQSPDIRPFPNTDGTPNESVKDVFVRVTQLMSILETQFSGQSVIIVSPDSDNLSILQAGLTGLDLRRHSDLAFAPGEVRFVDANTLPTPPPLVTGLRKCSTPPKCWK